MNEKCFVCKDHIQYGYISEDGHFFHRGQCYDLYRREKSRYQLELQLREVSDEMMGDESYAHPD